jgi:hypothetical protein
MLIKGCAERASGDAGRGLSAVLGKSMEVFFKALRIVAFRRGMRREQS